jgi:flagellar hook-associated protein 2
MSTTSSTSGSGFSALGVGSGLDLNTIIDGLMKIEGQGQNRLKNQVTNKNSLISVYQALNTKANAMESAAQGLNIPSAWKAKAATSSSTSVTATATTAAVSGSLSFVVKNLATAETLASSGTVASTDSILATGNILMGQGGSLGLGKMTGAGLAAGSHTVAVTQASTGAFKSGSALGNSVTFAGGETLTVNISGTPQSINMTAGTYSRSELATMISTASGGTINATINNDNSLRLTTTREGSAATIQVTGGTALGSLGLTAGAGTAGTNGVITVDGVVNNVTDIRPDGSNSVVLNSSAGTITTSFSGGLRAGTTSVKNVSLGDGKLSSVVNAINNANAGVSATAVQVAPNQYKLQLQSAATGVAGKISTDLSAFTSALGTFNVVNEAKDATLQVGTGPGAYEIKSSSNSVSTALPGVTIALTKADPTETVTVNVGGDVAGLTEKVKAMVTAANDTISYIKANSSYDQKSKVGGWLLGNSAAQRLQSNMYGAVAGPVSGAALSTVNKVGITVNQDGTYKFDESVFKAAYAADPEGVASMFVEGGTTGVSTNSKPGIAERMVALGKKATDTVDGWLTTAIKGENTSIEALNKQISAWDDRLAQRRTNLLRQFTAMDTAVANYKSQQTWLAGQISGLG